MVRGFAWDQFQKKITEIDALSLAPSKDEEQAKALIEQKDSAYRERDALVAALSKVWPSHLSRHPEEKWEDDWRNIVCIHGPEGQMTWHIHDSELVWFGHLKRDENCRWDGHTTEEKYRRLQASGKETV